MQPKGFIFRFWFLGEVLFKFDLPGALIKIEFYCVNKLFQSMIMKSDHAIGQCLHLRLKFQ